MVTRISVFGLLMAILFLPVASFAQNPGSSAKSIEDINIADVPNDSIVVISKEDTDVPGYVHEKYAFVDQDCPGGVEIVDHYGAPIDPNDPKVHQFEHAECADLRYRQMEDWGN